MKYVFRKKRNVILVTLLDFFGYLFVTLSRLFRKRPKVQFRRFLVIRMDHLGDVLWSLAVPKVLKENFAGCRVIFLTSSHAAPLLENNPFVDEVLIYDAPWFARGRFRRSRQSPGLFRLISLLRKKNIDVAFGLRGDLRENWLMARARIGERIGYGITGGGFFLTREGAYRKKGHEVEHIRDLLKFLRVKAENYSPCLYFSSEEVVAFKQKLAGWGLTKEEPFVAMQIGAGSTAKEWPAGHFEVLIDECLKRFPAYKIVLVGSGVGATHASPLHDGRIVDLRGKTSLRELCLLIQKASAFVGADSGPTHIAAVLGVPTVFLFSGTNVFERWRPLSDAATVLKHAVPCAPCHLNECVVPGHPCLAEIRPEAVLEALASKLHG